jgi:integrase/recombinase XerD
MGMIISLYDEITARICRLASGMDASEVKKILSEYDIQERIGDGGKDIHAKIKMFLAAKQIEGLSFNTLKSYKLELNIFTRYVQKEVSAITTADLRYYLSQFPKLKTASIALKLSTLKNFFAWLTDEEIIQRDPARKIKSPKKEKRVPKALDAVSLQILKDNCKTERELAIVEMLYATGARLSEIVRLNKDDIDFSRRTIILFGKGAKERKVGLTDIALYRLQNYLKTRKDDNPALFVSARAPYARLEKRGIQEMIQKIKTRAAVNKKVTPHIFRHTFASDLLAKCKDITIVQKLLGHSSPSTTEIYTVVSENRVQEIYQQCMGG